MLRVRGSSQNRWQAERGREHESLSLLADLVIQNTILSIPVLSCVEVRTISCWPSCVSCVKYNNTMRMMNVSQCSISLSNPSIRSGHLSNGILIIFYCNLLQNYSPSYTTSTKHSSLSYLKHYFRFQNKTRSSSFISLAGVSVEVCAS